MEADIQGQILGVTGRTSKSGQHQMFDVAFSDGNKYTTFDQGLANKASQYVNQQVTARVSVEQNGKYTNYNLVDFAPAGASLPAQAQPAAAGTPIQVAPQPVVIPQQQESKKFTEADATRITKLACLGSAVELVGQLVQGAGPEAVNEAMDLALAVSRKFYSEARSHEAPDAPGPSTPAEVAAVVPGVTVGVGAVEAPPAEAPSVEWK